MRQHHLQHPCGRGVDAGREKTNLGKVALGRFDAQIGVQVFGMLRRPAHSGSRLPCSPQAQSDSRRIFLRLTNSEARIVGRNDDAPCDAPQKPWQGYPVRSFTLIRSAQEAPSTSARLLANSRSLLSAAGRRCEEGARRQASHFLGRKRHVMRPVAHEIDASDFAFAAGHRRTAMSLLAGTLKAATPFSMAGLVGGLYGTKPNGFGGNLVDGPGRRLRRVGLLRHGGSIGRKPGRAQRRELTANFITKRREASGAIWRRRREHPSRTNVSEAKAPISLLYVKQHVQPEMLP
jgi:hypothetical protein